MKIKYNPQMDRRQNYFAKLVDIIHTNQRPRPDGSIDWGKAELQITLLMITIEKSITENIIDNLNKHISESEKALKESEGEDCEITKDYKLAIKNVIAMLKKSITNTTN